MRLLIMGLVLLAGLLGVFGLLGFPALCLPALIMGLAAFYLGARQSRLERDAKDRAMIEAMRERK